MNVSLFVQQSRRYASQGLGLSGSLLKHSLVPLSLFCEVLPERGLVLDLGCGEGMLANLVASSRPGLRVRGIDFDKAKIEVANVMASPNASFEHGDVLALPYRNAVGAILNDVLHHHPTQKQMEILGQVSNALADGGILILKEVDAGDTFDCKWTTFWDTRLYPADKLNFHGIREWRRMLFDAGFHILRIHRVRHPWPASRTVFVCRRRSTHALPPAVSSAAKVLVTGGTGFIGRHLVRHLCEHGIGDRRAEVTVLTRDPTSLPIELARCRTIEGDIMNPVLLREACAGVEYVFHLAADKDFFGSNRVFENNLHGTRSLIEALSGSTTLKRLVFSSSMGAIDRTPNDCCDRPLDEYAVASPVSAYGRAKLECERLIIQSGLPFAILRLPWCYGSGMTPITHIRALTEMVMRSKPVTFIDWPGRISILEVGECAKALTFLALAPDASGQVLFVCDGESIRFGTLFQEIGRIVGRRAGFIPMPSLLLKLAWYLRRWLPFTLKSLLFDALQVDDKKLRSLGFAAARRGENFLLPLAWSISEETHPSLYRSKALVTGAASGIGYSLSVQLAASGRQVLMVDCNPKVARLAASIPGAEAIIADLSKEQGLSVIKARLQMDGINWMINCAGMGVRADVGSNGHNGVDGLLALNIGALTHLSEAAVKSFKIAGEGILVNIASSAALQPLPGMAVYAASKSYVLNFSEALATEQTSPSITVITVCPSGTLTNFQAAAGVRRLRGERLLAPEVVAASIMRACDQRKSKTLFVGSRTFQMALAARLMPRSLSIRIWKHLMDAQR